MRKKQQQKHLWVSVESRVFTLSPTGYYFLRVEKAKAHSVICALRSRVKKLALVGENKVDFQKSNISDDMVEIFTSEIEYARWRKALEEYRLLYGVRGSRLHRKGKCLNSLSKTTSSVATGQNQVPSVVTIQFKADPLTWPMNPITDSHLSLNNFWIDDELFHEETELNPLYEELAKIDRNVFPSLRSLPSGNASVTTKKRSPVDGDLPASKRPKTTTYSPTLFSLPINSDPLNEAEMISQQASLDEGTSVMPKKQQERRP